MDSIEYQLQNLFGVQIVLNGFVFWKVLFDFEITFSMCLTTSTKPSFTFSLCTDASKTEDIQVTTTTVNKSESIK